MDEIHEINFQMSLVRLSVILVTYYGMEYLSWPLTFLLVVVIFCFYIHLDDQVLAQPQNINDIWRKEQEKLDKLIENWFGKKLGDFKLDWMNENDEESRRQKCKWVNELIAAIWLEGQDLVKDLIKKLFEDINENISDQTRELEGLSGLAKCISYIFMHQTFFKVDIIFILSNFILYYKFLPKVKYVCSSGQVDTLNWL